MRLYLRFAASMAAVAALVGCNEQQVQQGIERDQTPPTVTITKPAGDTLQLTDGIVFDVQATDNLGLKSLSVVLSGGHTAQFDTVLNTAVTDLTLSFSVPLPANSTSGGDIFIAATATDGNDNTTTGNESLFLVNSQALGVRILDPQANAVTAPGLQIPVNIEGTQIDGVRIVGYTTTGVVTAADSLIFTPLADTALFSTTLTVPGSASTGVFTITGFAVDSAGRRATSATVDVNVQTVVSDTDPPFVTVTVNPRVEVRDSITVTANDAGGVTLVGWLARDLIGTVVGGDSTSSSGVLTQLSGTYNLNLSLAALPSDVEIEAFGVDNAGNRGEARVDTSVTSPIKRDTILAVNGITKALPNGGRVADGIYNANRNELYLSNVDLNRLEVFQLVDTSYVPGGIPVGAQPWGLALWPRDTLGTNADTVVVANSGGTSMSIVDVSAAGRRERRRHRLPNFLVQSVQTELDPATNTIKIKITEFDFSDRPQYLGMTCRPPAASTVCAADSIYAVYSTAATPGQTAGFEEQGTMRWENLTAGTPHSHFFWEHAAVPPSPDTDTLQVLIDRGPTVAIETSLSAAKGITVNLQELAFRDTTFVRNSGNFTHTVIGEGCCGVTLARALGYNGNRLLLRTVDTTVVENDTIIGPSEVDFGITPGLRVRDFIANTATEVKSVGINFNGLTNLVRADSVYVLDEALRLAGIIAVGGQNPGMDINFQHAFDPFVGGTSGTFGGTADSSLRMAFVARDDANIDVYDTFFFEKVTTIPIRDPVIGPLRVALLPSGDQLIVGVTGRGVVTVQIPQIPNTFPFRAGRGGGGGSP